MADKCKLSAAALAESEGRSYVLKLYGYTSAKRLLKCGECVTSPPFTAGGHNWVVRFYPNGDLAEGGDYYTVVHLVLDSDSMNVKVKIRSFILVNDLQPFNLNIYDHIFPLKGSSVRGLFDRAAVEMYVIDDCINVVFDITFIKNTLGEKTMGHQFVVVPPSNLHRHFADLLESMDGADVTFHVGGQKFMAHSSVLIARSSVFKAELLGAMKEKFGSPIEIHEMEAVVFKSLLYFIYTDSLPALEIDSNPSEARLDVTTAGHLLVAADRYNVERLKLICEHKLCNHIDANMVATSLTLAEQHSCRGLKEACLQFLASPTNLEAMMASDGYEHLKSSCPSVLKELVARLLPDTMKAARDIIKTI
ncbi:hypothetical protein ACQJBY_012933 [Aegilops geniculata]